jgi:hypothetical protein
MSVMAFFANNPLLLYNSSVLDLRLNTTGRLGCFPKGRSALVYCSNDQKRLIARAGIAT